MIKTEIMESEEKKTTASTAEAKDKKPRARKATKTVAEKVSAPARKPRTRKVNKTENAAAPETPAAEPTPAPTSRENEPAAPVQPEKKPKVRRVKTKPEPAKETVQPPVPATEPAPSSPIKEVAAQPAMPQPQKEIPAPAPKVEEFTPTPQQPRERELEPAPGFATPETVGGNEGGGNGGKRRRRRNRNRRGGEGQPQAQQPTQPRVNPDELVRRAWKIFLGEVTEEGLALMDDRTAAEASRRAFRVAELFLQEAARRNPVSSVVETEGNEAEDVLASEQGGE